GLIGAKRHRVPNDPRKTSDCRAGGTAKPHGVDEVLLPDDRARQNSLALRCPQAALGQLLIFQGSTSRNSPPRFGSVRGCCVGASKHPRFATGNRSASRRARYNVNASIVRRSLLFGALAVM